MADAAVAGQFPQQNVRDIPGVARIQGRISAPPPRKFEKSYYSMVTLPAADSFSHPAVVEVRSTERLGAVGDDVDVKVRIGGFNRKAYDFTDKVTGDVRRVVPNQITLDVI